MLRRTLITGGLIAALPLPALAQPASDEPVTGARPQPPARRQPAPANIQPQNDLERAFLAAFQSEASRPTFRRLLMTSQVALATTSNQANAGPQLMPLHGEDRAGFIYTSAARLTAVLGPNAPSVMMTGRQAFARLTGQHCAINFGLAPMLTLAPEDMATYLQA